MFQSYPKISDKLAADARLSGRWVASEKIHGANLTIVHDGDSIDAARRKSILSPDEYGSFFGLVTIWPQLQICAQRLYESLLEPFILYGELAGGLWPNELISPDIAPVQGGIFYSPTLQYFALDIYLPQSDTWLADEAVRELAHAAKFLSPPLLGHGSYQQMMRLPIKFESHVPRMLGFNHLPGNLAEGLVLKPDKAMLGSERIVLKQKRNAFNETLSKGVYRKLATPRESKLVYEASRRLTPARVWAARSKVGSDQNAIAQEVLEDILVEIILTGEELSEEDCACVTSHLAEPIQQMVTENN